MALVCLVAYTHALVRGWHISLEFCCCATGDESPSFEHCVRVDNSSCAGRVVTEFCGRGRVTGGGMEVAGGSVGGAGVVWGWGWSFTSSSIVAIISQLLRLRRGCIEYDDGYTREACEHSIANVCPAVVGGFSSRVRWKYHGQEPF